MPTLDSELNRYRSRFSLTLTFDTVLEGFFFKPGPQT